MLPNKQAIKYKCLSHLKLKVHNGQNVRLSGAVCPVNKVVLSDRYRWTDRLNTVKPQQNTRKMMIKNKTIHVNINHAN